MLRAVKIVVMLWIMVLTPLATLTALTSPVWVHFITQDRALQTTLGAAAFGAMLAGSVSV